MSTRGDLNGTRRVLVRSAGDIGSAVAVRLFQAGHGVAVHEEPQPATTWRGMAFADAGFDGEARLDGVKAVRATRDVVPLFSGWPQRDDFCSGVTVDP